MNILMMTNVYTPFVGGTTRSIQAFSAEYRRMGHKVLIVTPAADGAPDDEPDVVRYPAVPNVYRETYSLPVFLPGYLYPTFRRFEPDVIHSHHPFLLGSLAQAGSALWDVPVVYTHHTRYDVFLEERKVVGPAGLHDFLVNLWTGYCNLCDAVIAPSQAVARILKDQGVRVRCQVIPTGVDVQRFACGDGKAFRAGVGIPAGAFVVGHLGRLSEEKNGGFLARAVAEYLTQSPRARFLLAGDGPCRDAMIRVFTAAGVRDRVHLTGTIAEARRVADAYAAMDVFCFASRSETQGMVLTEALAAGVPVVALEGPGVCDVIRDGHNGRLLAGEDEGAFAGALAWVAGLHPFERRRLGAAARATAERFSIGQSAEAMLGLYEEVVTGRQGGVKEAGLLAVARRFLDYERRVWSNRLTAVGQSLFGSAGQPAG